MTAFFHSVDADAIDADAIGAGADAVRRVWFGAAEAASCEGPVWVHGDCIQAHVIVADGHRQASSISAMFVGDPAAGLAAAWVLLSAGMAGRVLAASGEMDEVLARSRTSGG